MIIIVVVVVMYSGIESELRNFSRLQLAHAHKGERLVCVKSRQTDVIEDRKKINKNPLRPGIHGDKVSIAFYVHSL